MDRKTDMEPSRAPDRAAPASSGRRILAPTARSSAYVVVGGVLLYVAIDVILVFLRPQFSVLHNAESDYGSSGPWAWLMDLNFLLRCLLSLAVVRVATLVLADSDKSSRLRRGLWLMVVWAIGSGLLAFFPDDPVGTPLRWRGEIHLVLAFLAFLAVFVGAVLLSPALGRLPPWRRVGLPLRVLSWGALAPLVLLGHAGFGAHSLGGLYEKTFLAIELVWFFLVALPVAFDTKALMMRNPDS